jgi:hypothetical protein
VTATGTHTRSASADALAVASGGDHLGVGSLAAGTLAAGSLAAVGSLRAAVDEVVAGDLDAASDTEVRAAVAEVQRAVDRLTGFRTKALGALHRRAIAAAGPGREQPALRALRDDLADQLRIPASEVKRAGDTGRRIAELPAAQAAMDAGTLSGRHAAILAETLRWFEDPDVRDAAEARLLEAAASQDARVFARTARAVLVELDADSAQRRIDRQHAQRSLRASLADDGTLTFQGRGAGLDGELVMTGLHAFRSPDAPGQQRTPEQRSWDALVRMSRAALDAGVASENRGVRPHVTVIVAEEVVADRAGTGNGEARAAWTGAMPYSELRRVLADAEFGRLLIDARGIPIEASAGVRNVPVGLYRALEFRDVVCIADGCDVPGVWCDAMHLDVPYRLEGRLTLETAGLGCRFHHRKFDVGGWKVTWIDDRPVVHHPDRPPRVRPARDGPGP